MEKLGKTCWVSLWFREVLTVGCGVTDEEFVTYLKLKTLLP